MQEQDKSTDIEQQSPFGDRKYSNKAASKKGGLQNPTKEIKHGQSTVGIVV